LPTPQLKKPIRTPRFIYWFFNFSITWSNLALKDTFTIFVQLSN
jgi:hypothetical protein